MKKTTKKIGYAEPAEFFPKDIRDKYFGKDTKKKATKKTAPKKATAKKTVRKKK